MPRIKIETDLKKAIVNMAEREKDKILLRLLAKEPLLVDRLRFQLLEGGETMEDRRGDVKAEITDVLARGHVYDYAPGYALMVLRALSGDINRHVSATRDKFGEVELQLYMLNTCLDRFGNRLDQFYSRKVRTFSDYVTKRGIKIFKLMAKLHPDLWMEFDDDLRTLGKNIQRSAYLSAAATEHGLSVAALLRAEVPEEYW